MLFNVVTLCVGSANAKENCLIQETVAIMVEGKMSDCFRSESPQIGSPLELVFQELLNKISLHPPKGFGVGV